MLQRRSKLQVVRATRGVCTTCRATFLAPTVDEARRLLLEHWANTGHPTGTVNRKPAAPPPLPGVPKELEIEDEGDMALMAMGYDNYGVLPED